MCGVASNCLQAGAPSYPRAPSCPRLPYLLQKKVVKSVRDLGCRQYTNDLHSEPHILKYIDVVKLRTASIMCKAHKKLFANNIQLLVSLDSATSHITLQSNYNLNNHLQELR